MQTEIPEDVMKAAREAYDAPVREDGSSLVSLVNRMVEDDVKLAIARAIMAERERSQWQPIETAPKDGSYFLGLAKNGRWISQCKYVGPDERYPDAPLNWFMGVDGWPQPTHWMPMPAPPKQEA